MMGGIRRWETTLFFVELFHQALVFHLLMGGMLVNDEQLILELDQPVGIEPVR